MTFLLFLQFIRSEFRAAARLWLPGYAPLAGLLLTLFSCFNAMHLIRSCTPDTAVMGMMEIHTETETWNSLIPTGHIQCYWNYLYSHVVDLPLSFRISSWWLTFHSCGMLYSGVRKYKSFSFILLSCTVLKTKLFLDLNNLILNLTMQSISSFYLDFAFHKYFVLSFVQTPSLTHPTLSIFSSGSFCPEAKSFLQIPQF